MAIRSIVVEQVPFSGTEATGLYFSAHPSMGTREEEILIIGANQDRTNEFVREFKNKLNSNLYVSYTEIGKNNFITNHKTKVKGRTLSPDVLRGVNPTKIIMDSTIDVCDFASNNLAIRGFNPLTINIDENLVVCNKSMGIPEVTSPNKELGDILAKSMSEDFEKSIINNMITQKEIKVYKSDTITLTSGIERFVTVAVVLHGNGTVSAGYSVLHPDDVEKTDLTISKLIALNRAYKKGIKNPLLLENEFILRGTSVDRFLLLAIGEQLLKRIARGEYVIKGIR